MAQRDTYRTEHSGAKRGRGAWDRKVVAKRLSNKLRRRQDKLVVRAA